MRSYSHSIISVTIGKMTDGKTLKNGTKLLLLANNRILNCQNTLKIDKRYCENSNCQFLNSSDKY